MISGQRFQRAEEDVSRHLEDWEVELTWYHFHHILFVKASLKMKNEETVPILGGTLVYSSQAEKSRNRVNER